MNIMSALSIFIKNVIRLRCYHTELTWAVNSMTGILTKAETFGERQIHRGKTEGRTSYDDEGRDWSDANASQEHQELLLNTKDKEESISSKIS